MRHAAIYFVVFTLISLGAQTSSAQIAWEGKLRDAHAKAKQQGKLMLLHFYTDNCVYCERLEAGAFRSASVAKSINQNFVPVKVHGGKNPKLAQMFKVSKFPTDVIVTTDGKALSHSVSPQPPDRYIAMLTSAQGSYAKSKTLLASQKQPSATAAAAKSPAKTTVKTTVKTAVETPTAKVAAAPSTPPAYASNTVPATSTVSKTAPSTGMELPVQIPVPDATAETTAPPTSAESIASIGKTQQNRFLLPSFRDGNSASASVADAGATPAVTMTPDAPSSNGVKTSLASSHTNAISVPTADLLASTEGLSMKATPSSTQKPELAIQGYCAVSVVNKGEWVEGKPELGVIHLGKLYLFADKPSMEMFLTDPVPFTPMLNEIDVVRFFEEKKIVAGKREWGVIDPVHNRMFFFADEAAMLHFEESFDRYLEASIEVMNHAIEESNPGV